MVALTHLRLLTLPHHPQPTPYTCHQWYYSCCEKAAQNLAVLASYTAKKAMEQEKFVNCLSNAILKLSTSFVKTLQTLFIGKTLQYHSRVCAQKYLELGVIAHKIILWSSNYEDNGWRLKLLLFESSDEGGGRLPANMELSWWLGTVSGLLVAAIWHAVKLVLSDCLTCGFVYLDWAN